MNCQTISEFSVLIEVGYRTIVTVYQDYESKPGIDESLFERRPLLLYQFWYIADALNIIPNRATYGMVMILNIINDDEAK